jgi:miniconductance mechanosensitive channel
MREALLKYLSQFELSQTSIDVLAVILLAVGTILLALIAHVFVKKVLLRLFAAFIRRSKSKWDDYLLNSRMFDYLAHLAPAVVLHVCAPLFPPIAQWISRLVFCYVVLVIAVALDKLLNAIDDIYRNFDISKERPIKGFLQIIKIFLYAVAIVIVVSTLIDRSPLLLLSGIGAATAVLLLIFQNTILGFVAGIQLSANDMVRIGDWIEMSKYGADGSVIDITLHTVKVQNWDKTVTTIPTHALVNDSFRNWRAMVESGGRRIKRAVYIDITSVRFCDEAMIEKFKKIHLIQDYLESKQLEIAVYNAANDIDTSILVNGRHMTNIGVFRAYVQAYIKNHPGVNHTMTEMVRQLAPGEHGVPIEVYVFTTTTKWLDFEAIQSDIFDHIFAVVPEFGLRIYQSPTGHDVKSLSNPLKCD